jgi:hypothetical protein
MAEDPRSCGSIACIINLEGYCWCGLKWNGQKMARAPLENTAERSLGKTSPATAKPRRQSPAKKTRTAR